MKKIMLALESALKDTYEGMRKKRYEMLESHEVCIDELLVYGQKQLDDTKVALEEEKEMEKKYPIYEDKYGGGYRVPSKWKRGHRQPMDDLWEDGNVELTEITSVLSDAEEEAIKEDEAVKALNDLRAYEAPDWPPYTQEWNELEDFYM